LRFEPTGYSLPGPWARLLKWVRRQPWRAAATGIAMIAVLALTSAWAWNMGRSSEAADFFIHDVQTVPFPELPRKIKEITGYRGWVYPRVREMLKKVQSRPDLRARLALVLLPSEPARASELAERLLDTGPEEHRVIREALRLHWSAIEPRLRTVIEDSQSAPVQRARAATALIALDGAGTPTGSAWSALRLAAEPTLRVELLNWLVRSEVDSQVLAARLDIERDTSVRRLLIQALGDLGHDVATSERDRALLSRLTALYRDDPDPGVHSSIAYLMRRWRQGSLVKRIDAEMAGKPRGTRQWFVNSLDLTFAVLGDSDGLGLSPSRAGSPIHRFSIATTETTLALQQKFDSEYPVNRKKAGAAPQSNVDAAADVVSFDDAARFCNWLSQEEGLPPDQWCYAAGGSKGGMALVPDYLSRRGYRLPTLQEWEYAARAGTSTERYFGQSSAQLGDYAWYAFNTEGHPEPVGQKRPNDFGLFDVIGNVMEWCYNPNPPHRDECDCRAESGATCRNTRFQSLRGGSFVDKSSGFLIVLRSVQYYDTLIPAQRWPHAGFRVVKGMP
jgi:hypothetical protein